jgi:mono/diheme cytochrome c family protein
MTRTTRAIGAMLMALGLAGSWNIGFAAQQTRRTPPPSLVIPSTAGGDLFRFYCATCHGRDGKGDGPVAAALNRRPADLTLIARRNGGHFPAVRMEDYVTGNREPMAPPAHGSMDMPVWGPIFQALDPQDVLNRVRIANIMAFVESIQVK